MFLPFLQIISVGLSNKLKLTAPQEQEADAPMFVDA